MNKAIVVGAPHHNTLGLIRSLGIKGLSPLLYLITSEDNNSNVKSKYVSEVKYFKTEEDVVQYLLNSKTKEKAVLFASGDPISLCLDIHYEELKDKYYLFNIHGKMKHYMNKETMCSIAEKIGFHVPQHFVYIKGDRLPLNIEFPCITKAISSVDGDKSNTTICETRQELEKFISAPNLCKSIQIERFVKKKFEFQFIGLSLNAGEIIVIPGHSHIHRPKGIQNTFCFMYKENSNDFFETLNKTKRFIKEVGYSGLFSMEFIRGIDGKDYFLEMNYRNDGNAICVTDAGFNLPYFWYKYSMSDDIQQEIQECKLKEVFFCPEETYALQCAYGEVTLLQFVRNLLRANSFTNYYKGDSTYYWLWYIYFAFKQVVVKRLLIKIGILKAPKESVG